MTRWRGRWLVAVLIAVLAVIGCGVGIAGEATDEKQLIISSPSDDVILYIGEGNEVISSSASLHFRAEFDDYKTPIDKIEFTFTRKDSGEDILKDVTITNPYTPSNTFWGADLKYSPAATGTCVYTVTASIPETEYKASKDIAFTVTDDTSSLPTSIELDSKYFDENGVYKEELVIDETTGTAVITDAVDILLPKYEINGSTEECRYSCTSSTFRTDGMNFTFQKAGKYTIRFRTVSIGSNWELTKEATFIVKSANEPQNPITITGVPEDDTLISSTPTDFTIKVENPELLVNWEVTCDNDKIRYNKHDYSGADISTLEMYVWCNEVGVTGTFTVKAWYEGYETNAAIKTFNVHTKDKEFAIWNSIGDITLYLSNDSKYILPSATLYIGVGFDDYKTPIDKVEFSFTPKGSGSDILKDVTTTEPRPSNNNALWSVDLHYSPATTGTCVYTATAATTVDGKEYKASKDITFTVTDNTSGLPTSIELDSKYFDENGVYKEELVIDETTGTAVIADARNILLPEYTINGISQRCGFYIYDIDTFEKPQNDFVFKKAGKHTLGFYATQEGSNWRITRDVTFIVKPTNEPQNPITITGVPEDDTLISSTPTDFTIKVENPEQSVSWDVVCDNDSINVLKDVSNDGNTLTLTVWSYTKGITSTITVKAYYAGYENKATTAAFNVYTESPKLILSELPDEVTLYIGNKSSADYSDKLLISNSTYLYATVFFDNYKVIDDINFDFQPLDGDSLKIISKDVSFSDTKTMHWLSVCYTGTEVGKYCYMVSASIPNTDYKVEKLITFNVINDISILPSTISINHEYFDANNVYTSTELIMPDDGSSLELQLPDEAVPSYILNGEKKLCINGSNDGVEYDTTTHTLRFNKAGKHEFTFRSDSDYDNWQIYDTVTFIVKSNNKPERPSLTITGIPTEDILVEQYSEVVLKVEDCEQIVTWEVSFDSNQFAHYDSIWFESDVSTLTLRIYSNVANASSTVTVKAYYYGYENTAAIATFKVHTKPEEKPIFELNLRNDGIYNLYSGENDGTLTIKTSGSFYLGSIEFSDKSPIHEFEPVITLIPNDESGAFGCSVYSYNGNIGGEDGPQIKVAKLKYESLPAVGTHEYTLHVEIPGTDYTAEAPVTINVIDGTTVLPREIVLLPETEALFTNDVYNQSLYLDSNGKASVSLDLARDDSNESPNLHTVCDKFIYCHDECTKGVTEDRKYMFTFDGAGQHYVVLHLASDYSNWYVERPLTFNVLDLEPVITSEPYYPPYIPPEEPTAMPTAEPVPVPTQAPTAEPVPVPTLAPTVEPAPTPTPAPIKEVTAGGKNLNVRLSPVSGAVVAKLPDGTRLEVLGTENGWSRVRATLPDGSVVEGFVMDVYLSDTAPTASPAVPTPAATTTSPAVPTPAATVTAQPGATTTPAPLPSGEPTEVPTEPVEVTAMVNTNGSALRLRSNPSTRSDVLARMPNGAEITILESVDGWTRIKFVAQNGDEYEGWASSDFIKPAERPTPTAAPLPTAAPEPTAKPEPTATPAANSAASVSAGGKKLNLRSAPGASDPNVAAKLPDGAELIVLEYGEEWSLCSYNGITGYCATKYLKFT